jgi:hypothetical protein
VEFEYDVQIFDKFKSLDSFDNTFAVTSHSQIHGTVPFDKLVVPDIAQNIVRIFVEIQCLLKCLQVPAILFSSYRIKFALPSSYIIYLCIYYFGSVFNV